ncbi:MAG: pyruvate, phosphate dikinase [Planctomycetes bacterium]|jgi:pyruvate,orthophosphate dikinase|nr:pyruvate, phosphate dikinase [Planctomycetota bacterium]
MSFKYVYFFGGKSAEGDASMRNTLGGKGANLCEMARIGLPVPAGFTLTTDICTYFYGHNKQYPPELKAQVLEALKKTEDEMGAKLGDPANPLLVSCRSGARDSMPGMMDTVLNIGLNEKTLAGLIAKTGNERFGWDTYRRFVQMYGDVVLGLKPTDKKEIDPFEKIMEELKHEKGVHLDNDLTVDDLKELVKRFKKAVKDRTGLDFPDDAHEQMWGAIGAVFGSWMNDRAIVYRRQYNIPHEWGTAANICAMVFGNMGDDCCTGVAFTRDPASGDNVFYGEYLTNAQGEDVVAGIRTPKKIAELKDEMPAVYGQLEEVRNILEKHYRDVQDIEFTVQKGKLWMLQTRNGKRTGFAAVKFAVDMVDEGLIEWKEAIGKNRIPPDDLNQLLQPIFDISAKKVAVNEGRLLAKGINAGPGAATGRIKFFAEDAEKYVQTHGRKDDHRVILVRRETSPEDIRGMQAADGILTAFGGASSHAALVSRQMGKVCIVGCSALQIDYEKMTLKVGEHVLHDGDWISIDGFTGEVVAGKVATKPSEVVQVLIEKSLKPGKAPVYKLFEKVMKWADKVRKLDIRTNADQPDQAEQAVAFGAEGIGLCRTEHMFFNHIREMREMILAASATARKAALEKLLPFQREDFAGLFRAMKGMPVTIRTLDPPLHEFLPHDLKGQEEMAREMGVSVAEIEHRVKALHEFNPMLGFRGCRLGIVFPEITEMQAQAIFEAACIVKKEGIEVKPEIMIPLVGFKRELDLQAGVVHAAAKKVFKEQGASVEYLVGTMIELPRAAMAAGEIAETAQFFSFGTNDLTQTGLGMSRDDYGSFIPTYLEHEVVKKDPFQVIDFPGIGRLMEIGVQGGRGTRKDLKIGICGEHGGEPDSVKFCHKIGLNYVSCSPFRVPVARLAAAQAVLEEKAAKKKAKEAKAAQKKAE